MGPPATQQAGVHASTHPTQPTPARPLVFPLGREGWAPSLYDSYGDDVKPHVLSPAGALMRSVEAEESGQKLNFDAHRKLP